MTGIVEILRDGRTKSAAVNVAEDMEWALYAGPSAGEIDMMQPVAEYRADGWFPLDVPVASRSYFQLVCPRGTAILAERMLPMEGGYNFRDLGGYRAADGRYVKWGAFIRSDELANLTESDMAYLASVPVRSVVDFRAQSEIDASPDRYPGSVENKYHLEVNPGNVIDKMESDIGSTDAAEESMREMNRAMVSDPGVVAQYREFFRILQQEGQFPVVYHCAAGKDRTGMASALILLALGVDEDTVMHDYLLSNEYLGDKYKTYIETYPQAAPLMVVDRSYLQAGLDKIKELYGSYDGYLTGTLGVDIPAFRDKYLY